MQLYSLFQWLEMTLQNARWSDFFVAPNYDLFHIDDQHVSRQLQFMIVFNIRIQVFIILHSSSSNFTKGHNDQKIDDWYISNWLVLWGKNCTAWQFLIDALEMIFQRILCVSPIVQYTTVGSSSMAGRGNHATSHSSGIQAVPRVYCVPNPFSLLSTLQDYNIIMYACCIPPNLSHVLIEITPNVW